MKNIQVIDGAVNCVYDVFAASDDDHALLFPDGTDMEFLRRPRRTPKTIPDFLAPTAPANRLDIIRGLAKARS